MQCQCGKEIAANRLKTGTTFTCPACKKRYEMKTLKDEFVGKTFGKYKILELVGKVRDHIVYRAWDPDRSYDVAIKVLDPELCSDKGKLMRFKQEVSTLSKIQSSHIVKMFDVGIAAGRAYLVREYIEGKTLRDIMRGKKLPQRTAAYLLVQACKGLRDAHKLGILHRDLTPDFMVFNKDGKLVITDFIFARDTDNADPRLTVTCAIEGSPEYLAPEMQDPVNVDQRVDIYSLGIIAYEMLAGKPPFRGASEIEIYVQHCTEPMPNIMNERPDLDPKFKELIETMTAKEMGLRYQNVDKLLADLIQLTKKLNQK